jgi:hypothetical protein
MILILHINIIPMKFWCLIMFKNESKARALKIKMYELFEHIIFM